MIEAEAERRRHFTSVLLPRACALVAALVAAGIEPGPAIHRLLALPTHATHEDAGGLAVFWSDFRTMRVLVTPIPDIEERVIEGALLDVFALALSLR